MARVALGTQGVVFFDAQKAWDAGSGPPRREDGFVYDWEKIAEAIRSAAGAPASEAPQIKVPPWLFEEILKAGKNPQRPPPDWFICWGIWWAPGLIPKLFPLEVPTVHP